MMNNIGLAEGIHYHRIRGCYFFGSNGAVYKATSKGVVEIYKKVNRVRLRVGLCDKSRKVMTTTKDRLMRTYLSRNIYFREARDYNSMVWIYSEVSVGNLKRLRKVEGNCLDHIVPISYGFRNKIPTYLIGSRENLQILTRSENIRKGIKITDTAKAIIHSWKSKGLI